MTTTPAFIGERYAVIPYRAQRYPHHTYWHVWDRVEQKQIGGHYPTRDGAVKLIWKLKGESQ